MQTTIIYVNMLFSHQVCSPKTTLDASSVRQILEDANVRGGITVRFFWGVRLR